MKSEKCTSFKQCFPSLHLVVPKVFNFGDSLPGAFADDSVFFSSPLDALIFYDQRVAKELLIGLRGPGCWRSFEETMASGAPAFQ